jgi:hypothetical protein
MEAANDQARDPSQTRFHGVGAECDPKYQQWWAERRHGEEPPNPAEVLLRFGIPLEVIQSMFWNMMSTCCLDLKGPGLMDCIVRRLFLERGVSEPPRESSGDQKQYGYWRDEIVGGIESFQQHYEEEDSVDGDSLRDFVSEELVRKKVISVKYDQMLAEIIRLGPETDQVSEQDVCTLVDLTRIAWKDKPDGAKCWHWGKASNEFLRYKYDSTFLQNVFARFPVFGRGFWYKIDGLGHGSSPEYRNALDHSCVLGMKELLPKVENVKIVEERWTRCAFLQFLDISSQTSELESLSLTVPTRFVSEPSSSTAPICVTSCSGKRVCSIEDINIRRSDPQTLLDAPPHPPKKPPSPC